MNYQNIFLFVHYQFPIYRVHRLFIYSRSTSSASVMLCPTSITMSSAAGVEVFLLSLMILV